MTITEKISAYISRLVSKGQLHPGDRLPSYDRICREFGITYSSAQRAFKNLEHEGLIKIVNGIGSFLNGGDTLNVDFFTAPTSFDMGKLQELLMKISDQEDLHLQITVKSIKGPDFQTNVAEHKVVISELDPWMNMPGCPIDFSEFPDYDDFFAKFKPFSSVKNQNLQLPWYTFTHQAAANTAPLAKIGMAETLTEISTLDWWNDFAEKCRGKGLVPAENLFTMDSLWSFPLLNIAVFLMLQEGRSLKNLFEIPFFTTPAGKRMFEIMDSFHFIERRPFLAPEVCLDLDVGSWISVQHKRVFGLEEQDFRILPITVHGQKVLRCQEVALQTFTNPTVTENEKERIWRFLKTLLSKKYQKAVTALNGGISSRRDMAPEDYEWFTRPDYAAFFPGKNDLTYTNYILSNEKLAVLGTLYEQYKTYGAPMDTIRLCMDRKLVG